MKYPKLIVQLTQSLANLLNCLIDCKKLIEKFTKRSSLIRALTSSTFIEEFSDLNNRLCQYGIDLSSSVNITGIFGKKYNESDQQVHIDRKQDLLPLQHITQPLETKSCSSNNSDLKGVTLPSYENYIGFETFIFDEVSPRSPSYRLYPKIYSVEN
ncbi:unnamed protein product [Didymodactylos carnosus]|uniref:Mixed lineage kinase domain-containing protein n=1 Tax=Didymodactylos carnosus TaxID=1234261 RepID=A0A814IDT7_9BILA|nr:unnamed protein product [Didymodactylos carnosus]CAF1022123.1 unnamed protein product [Didymodactylos carnosus]CAF3751307.1 unnamed protein product [Didymodactylos carnosus]CAF3793558.1 unnamed protein product [Didymodactylos carnosus]